MTEAPIKRRGWWFIRDIITKAELRHQWYVLEKSRSGTAWIVIAVLMLLPAVLITFYLLAMVILGLSITWNPFSGDIGATLISIGFVSLIVMNVSLYLIVILITLGLSSNSITRERKGLTWDVLLLTNVDARQVVLGKWWASLVALWGDHAMIAFVRVGAVCAVVLTLEPYMGIRLTPAPLGISPVLAHTVVLSLIAIAYTAIDAMFTAALGVGGAVSSQNSSIVSGMVFTARFVAIAIFIFWVAGMYNEFKQGWGYIPTAFLGLGIFALFTWIALRVGEWAAVQGEVSPPQIS
ncbi:MAG: hypothetical protein SFZ02_17620 [bacterium]|nr:hypothetical protein [bacterium]